ncbi:uncharacterized protein LOC119423103 [Nematolebias whitei]|uniref:uncharacterized protein LOC119423103 n=1 Tax=Nematolebias whitei TaxID=451745 RepID=UPI00189786FD|nr:uncharacterized protein LOC119423103 [Nematolebias whitei]
MAPGGSFVWTDREVELLLNTVLEYKVNKTQENVDWESCQNKYVDILALFLEHYPTESSDEFPHSHADITRGNLTTKMKAVRGKYRHAVDTGRRSGHGRVVLLYFELCEQIWGGSPASTTISSGIETADLDHSRTLPSPSTSSSSITMDVADTGSDNESSVGPTSKERRDLLDAKLKGHRHDRLRRKLPAETQWLNALEEDQRVKKRLVEIIETSEQKASENYSKMSNTLERLTTSIVDGFSLLKQVIHTPAQPPHYMPYEPRGPMYSHTMAHHSVHQNSANYPYPNNSTSDRTRQNTRPGNTMSTEAVFHTPAEATDQFSFSQALFSDQ